MNINILKKHIAVGEKRPFNTSDAASVRKEQKLDPKELMEKLNDLIKKTFPCKIGFEFIDHFIQGLSQKQLNEFIQQLDAEPTGVEGFPFEENNVLDWVLYSHNEKTIMMPLFHLVARYGSKDSIKAVLKWAEQNDTQLGLLSTAITGNDKGSNGWTFFHLVACTLNSEIIKAILKWVLNDEGQLIEARQALLKTQVTDNDSGLNGYTFFHLVACTLNLEKVNAVLAWAEQDDDRLGLLSTAVTDNDSGFNGYTFFHMVAKTTKTENINAVLAWAGENKDRLKILKTPITGNDKGLNGHTFFHMVVQSKNPENINAVLEWVTEDSSRLELLKAAITGNNKGLNGYSFFHLVGRFGSKEAVEDVLAWAAQDSSRLGLLTTAITGNDERGNGSTFFHMVARQPNPEHINAVLAWAEQDDDRLGLLTTAITGNDKGFNGYSFFHFVACTLNLEKVNAVLAWAEQDDDRLGLLSTAITDNDKGLNGHTFFHMVARSASPENIKAVLAWVNKEELYSHRLELLKAPITGNDEAFNGSTFFHLVNNHSELLLEFIQTLANEGRNLEFMLHPNKRYQFPIFLLMGVHFREEPDFKTNHIMLLTKILNQQQFPKGTEHDGACPITQDSLAGQAIVYIQTVGNNGESNSHHFMYSVSGAIQLLCRPMAEANSRQQIEAVLFRRP